MLGNVSVSRRSGVVNITPSMYAINMTIDWTEQKDFAALIEVFAI